MHTRFNSSFACNFKLTENLQEVQQPKDFPLVFTWTHPLVTSCPTPFSSYTGSSTRACARARAHTHTHTHTCPPPPVFRERPGAAAGPTTTSTRGPGSELTAGLAPSRRWDTEPLTRAKGCSTGVPGARGQEGRWHSNCEAQWHSWAQSSSKPTGFLTGGNQLVILKLVEKRQGDISPLPLGASVSSCRTQARKP